MWVYTIQYIRYSEQLHEGEIRSENAASVQELRLGKLNVRAQLQAFQNWGSNEEGNNLDET